MGRTCGELDEIKKNTHPKNTTALFREQAGTFCAWNNEFYRTNTNTNAAGNAVGNAIRVNVLS